MFFFQDNKADLVINYYVDDILERVMNILGIDIPPYNEDENLTKLAETAIVDWTIQRKYVLALEKIYKAKCKGVKKKRSLIKNKRNTLDDSANNEDDKSKVIKLEIKEESTKESNGRTESDEDVIQGTSVLDNNVSNGHATISGNGHSNCDGVPENVENNETSVTELITNGEIKTEA